SDMQEQLAELRRRVARIDRKYAAPSRPPPPRPVPVEPEFDPSEFMSGNVVETALGRHFETERCWERHRRHGSFDISCLAELPAEFDELIAYNGKPYDQPLLETRDRMTRSRPPFGRMEHVDLLHSARRLWKLRFDSCRLVELESQILGVERQGDLPGELIPYV